MSAHNWKFLLRGSISCSPFKMGGEGEEKYFACDRIWKKFSPLKPAALVFQSLAFKCPAREVLTITCCTSLQVRNGLGKDKVRIIVPKKKKKMGEAESQANFKKRKQNGKVLKTKGQRFESGLSKCQMLLLFSTWRRGNRLREAGSGTLHLSWGGWD